LMGNCLIRKSTLIVRDLPREKAVQGKKSIVLIT
jgi:hypothetical protein